MKQFNLTKEDQMNLEGRKAMAEQYRYISDLIRQNMQEYIEFEVKPRLGLKPEDKCTVDIEKGVIQLLDNVQPSIKGVRKDEIASK